MLHVAKIFKDGAFCALQYSHIPNSLQENKFPPRPPTVLPIGAAFSEENPSMPSSLFATPNDEN